MRDQAEKLRQMVSGSCKMPRSSVIKQNARKARVIVVTSGKGGVGKTNFTVNLALVLAGLDQKILVFDADLGTANVDVIMGQSPRYSLFSLFQGEVSINDIIADGPRGIKFLSGGSGIYQLAALSEPQIRYLVSQIARLDSWADVILVDTGAGISRNVLDFAVAADEVIVITTPEPTAITDAYAVMKAYSGYHGAAPLRLVINRVADADEGQAASDKLINAALRFLNLKITNLGLIYEDRCVSKAVKKQEPFVLAFPNSISTRCMENIGHKLMYGDETEFKPGGIRGFFHRFLEKVW